MADGLPTDDLLRATAVVVRYGPTTALDRIDLDVRRGEIHAVVGENGAGKSTLLRVLAGSLEPDSGSVAAAATARVAWVPQEAVLPPDFDAASWIFLAQEWRTAFGWLRTAAMRAAARDALRAIGCAAGPQARLGTLTISQRKQVQLARALRDGAEVLLLDEPTAALGARETQALFAVLRERARGGAGIVYVSHRLEEVLGLAHRITVLRDGRSVATYVAAAVDTRELVRAMVGRDLPVATRVAARDADELLQVGDLAVGHVRAVSLSVRAGEIVGVAGLVGAGRSALLEAVAGLRPLRGGSLRCAATPVLVPEDRQRKGLVPTLGMRSNVFLPAEGWRLRWRAERRRVLELIEQLRIRATGPDAPIESLSGGNQQKVLLGRALRRRPALLLLDEPTAGVDVGAKAEIHAAILQLASSGTGVLLASSDLTELLALCNRIVVLAGGRCAGSVAADETSEAALAALMLSSGDDDSSQSSIARTTADSRSHAEQ
jgi:ABC-type sugar transport system ATPase subunit